MKNTNYLVEFKKKDDDTLYSIVLFAPNHHLAMAYAKQLHPECTVFSAYRQVYMKQVSHI